MSQGLNSLNDRVNQNTGIDMHLWEKQINAREFERQQQINKVLT